MKTFILAAALFVCAACGDSTAPAGAPDTAQTATSPSASAPVTPTPVASPTPVAAQTVVTFLDAPLAVKRGSNATLQVKTAANTPCSIAVEYKSGPSTAAGLIAKNSDGAGYVSWTWKVGTNTTPGSWPITVTCGGATAQTQINVT